MSALAEDGECGEVFVRRLVSEFDEPERESELVREGRDRARKVGCLERVDERVDEPDQGHGVTQPELLWRGRRVRLMVE